MNPLTQGGAHRQCQGLNHRRTHWAHARTGALSAAATAAWDIMDGPCWRRGGKGTRVWEGQALGSVGASAGRAGLPQAETLDSASKWAGLRAHVVAAAAVLKACQVWPGERGPACSPVPPSPRPSLSPHRAWMPSERQRAIEASEPAGGGELRLPGLFWDLQTQNHSALTRPRRLRPQEQRVLRAKNRPPSGLTHSNTLLLTCVHTHSMSQASRTQIHVHPLTQVCTGTGCHTLTCVHTHCTPSCNAKLAPRSHNTHWVCPQVHGVVAPLQVLPWP